MTTISEGFGNCLLRSKGLEMLSLEKERFGRRGNITSFVMSMKNTGPTCGTR